MTDANGGVFERYRYDVFGTPTIYDGLGKVLPNSSSVSNRFMFTGREYAAAFGFYEYRARAYHPGLGRFMSEDPKLFDAGDYNLFRYCHNDPGDMTDPMGLETDWGGAGPQNPGNHYAMEREIDITTAERISLWQKSMESSIGGEQASLTLQSLEQMPKIEKGNPEGSQLRSIDPSRPRTMKEFIAMGNAIEHGNTMDTRPSIDVIDLLSGGIAGMVRSVTRGVAAEAGAEDLIAVAQKAYPGKAGITELHHITPKYLGGPANGPVIRLDAAYHQQITNEFRSLWPYGGPKPSAGQLQEIMQNVYGKYPLPPGN